MSSNNLPTGLEHIWLECVHVSMMCGFNNDDLLAREWRSCYDRLHGFAAGNHEDPELLDTLCAVAWGAFWEAKYHEIY